MITVELNVKNFEYDIHSLVKAFYPEQEVRIIYGKAPEEGTEELPRLVVSFLPEDAPRGGDAGADAGIGEAPEDVRLGEAPGQVRSGEVSEDARLGEATDGGQIEITLYAGTALLAGEQEVLPPGTDRKETKNHLKRLLYRLLSSYTGQQLPWGTLTGIRPTKIPMALLEQGREEEDIARYMRDTYYTSDEKTDLAIGIARREKKILRDINFKNGYSLYVGIPFCPSICLYCSFSSSPIHLWKDQVDDYLDALCREIDYASGAFADKELNTVYIGGGTPTTLEPRQMDRLLCRLEKRFCFDRLQEFTVEAGRPDSITREKLAVLREHGISRISINPQTMNQETLDLIGRRHTVEETVQAFYLAREMGFDNINMDLIVGLPGEEKPQVEHTMEEILKLDPDNITVHSLAVKWAARLRLFKEEHREMTMTNNREIMDMTASLAAGQGLYPYYLYRQKNMAGNFENVGYAKAGKAGIYNILIMEEVQSILALGAGASTKLVWAKDRIERIENVKDIRNYIDRIDEMIDRKRAGNHE